MNIAATPAALSGVSPEEWKVRVELAALYRVVAHFRMTDLIYTHISARVPGPEHHFLINQYGVMFHEMRASDLVKIDVDGNIVETGNQTSRRVNRGGVHDPLRHPHGARGPDLRHPHPHRRRHGRRRPEERPAAHQPARAEILRQARLSRLRRRRAGPGRTGPPGRRPGPAQRDDPGQPRPADRRAHHPGSLQQHLLPRAPPARRRSPRCPAAPSC